MRFLPEPIAGCIRSRTYGYINAKLPTNGAYWVFKNVLADGAVEMSAYGVGVEEYSFAFESH